ncbi:MAG: MTH1187 family thiamine-binding protein [Thermoplasmata archaeon]
MIVEFSILPVGVGESLSKQVAKALNIVDESGLKYQFTPMGTILEGEYKPIMKTIRRCHLAVLEDCERVVTTIKMDDRKHAVGEIEKKVASVENLLGRELEK